MKLLRISKLAVARVIEHVPTVLRRPLRHQAAKLLPNPTPGSIAPLRMDLRGLWALVGAWGAALVGVNNDQHVQAIWAVISLGLAGIAVLFVLRKRHGALAGESTPLFATPALLCAASGVVFAQMLLSGATLVPPELSHALESANVLRVQLVLGETPQVRSSINQFAEGAAPLTTYRAQGTLLTIRENKSWVPLAVPVVLNYPPELAPADFTPSRDTRLEVLARIVPNPPGQRNKFRLTALSPLTGIDLQHPGIAATLRNTFITGAQVLPEQGRALLPGMVFGDRSGQSQELGDAMKAAGLSHLSAVSGANCAMVLGAVGGLLRLFGVPRVTTLLVGIGSLVGFVMLVGYEPSVLRAAVMGAIAAFAVHSSRGRNALSALCLAVVILLVIDPYLATEAAFQLSTLATAGIVMIGRKLAEFFRQKLPEFLAEGTAIAVSAQIACLPVLVSLSPTFSLYSVPANLLVAPLIPWITITGTLGIVVLSVFPVIGMALVWASGIPATLVGIIGVWVAELPGALRPWPVGVLGLVLAWGIFIAVFFSLGFSTHRQGSWHAKIPSLIQAVTVGLLMGLTLPVTGLVPTARIQWLIAVCDVGQGDAIVLNTGDNTAILVDTGREPQDIDACLGRLRVKEIAAIFITHRHADHDAGITGAGRNRKVKALYFSILDDAADPPGINGIQAEQLAAGATGNSGNIFWQVLAPARGDTMNDENDASLVTRFEIMIPSAHRSISFLETGDMQEKPMGELLATGKVRPADILKIAHHGARNGGTDILASVHPALALISVGKTNTYGHPSPHIIEALGNAGIPVLRTDEHGTIVLSWNRDQLRVSTISTRPIGP